jgi:hypothetical protein
METIDVRGLPEPIAKVLQTMVQTLRQQLQSEERPRLKVELPAWPGRIIGSLRRVDIYDHAL